MNKPVTGADLVIPKVTTGSLPASRKVYSRPDAAPDLRVPLREIMLDASSGEPPLPVYDTTGPYTDPDVAIDDHRQQLRGRKGLPAPASLVEDDASRLYHPPESGSKGERIAEGDLLDRPHRRRVGGGGEEEPPEIPQLLHRQPPHLDILDQVAIERLARGQLHRPAQAEHREAFAADRVEHRLDVLD